MQAKLHKFPTLLVLLALAGCATLPSGPSVMVLPAPGKPFEVFQSEDALCRKWAEQQTGSDAQQAYEDSTASGAAVGTAIGAGVGALLGAAAGNPAAGAAIGAGGGLLAGTAAGADRGEYYGMSVQRRYDTAFVQCMYANGNQVPGTARRNYRRRTYSPPPPPPGYEAAPPSYQTAPESVPMPPDYQDDSAAPPPAPPEL